MAQEKAPRIRARKTAESVEKPAAPAKKTTTRAKSAEALAKPVVSRTRRAKQTAPTHAAIAVRAYYLWQRGERGTPDELWLKAETELQAA